MALVIANILFDTSVIIAAIMESHPKHLVSLLWIQKVKKAKIEETISSHSLIEIYSVLTTFPLSPKISPAVAWKLIRENIIKDFEIITYKRNDYLSILNELVENQVSGGSSYDSLIAYSIEKTKVDKILTLNSRDFIRVKPEAANIIAEP